MMLMMMKVIIITCKDYDDDEGDDDEGDDDEGDYGDDADDDDNDGVKRL